MFWRSLPNDDLKFSYLRWWRQRKLFIFCLCMKTIRAKQAKVHFVYFVQRDQHGVIAKDLTSQSSILMGRFRCSRRRSFLNFLIKRARDTVYPKPLTGPKVSTNYHNNKGSKFLQVKTFARIESVCTFRDGLSFLFKSISFISSNQNC